MRGGGGFIFIFIFIILGLDGWMDRWMGSVWGVFGMCGCGDGELWFGPAWLGRGCGGESGYDMHKVILLLGIERLVCMGLVKILF